MGTTGLAFPTPWPMGNSDAEIREGSPQRLATPTHDSDEAGMPWASAKTFRLTVGDLVAKSHGAIEASKVIGMRVRL